MIFMAYLLLESYRTSKRVSTVEDFLCFGVEKHSSMLRKTFEGTNITYGTIFVAFILYPSSYGLGALALPIGFILGIVFFVLVILPRLMRTLVNNMRYPELLENSTGSKFVRRFVAVMMVLSLWVFTFAEVQAVSLLISELFQFSNAQTFIMSATLVITVALYLFIGGYQSMLKTDYIQMAIVYAGSVSLLFIIFMELNRIGYDNIQSALVNKEYVLVTSLDYGVFFVEMILALLFAQIIYYDNWQRLTLYIKSQMEDAKGNNIPYSDSVIYIQKHITSSYLKGTLFIGLIYLLPMGIGVIYIADSGDQSAIAYTVNLLKGIWADYQAIGALAVLAVIMMLFSSLLSTLDSYSIGAANILYEDIAGKNTQSHAAKELTILKWIVLLFLFSIILFLPYMPNFEILLLYLIYSANGMIGPIITAVIRNKVNKWAVMTSVMFGFLFPIYSLQNPDDLASQFTGLIIISFSLIITWQWKQSTK